MPPSSIGRCLTLSKYIPTGKGKRNTLYLLPSIRQGENGETILKSFSRKVTAKAGKTKKESACWHFKPIKNVVDFSTFAPSVVGTRFDHSFIFLIYVYYIYVRLSLDFVCLTVGGVKSTWTKLPHWLLLQLLLPPGELLQIATKE